MGLLNWLFNIEDLPEDVQDNPLAGEDKQSESYTRDDLVADIHASVENMGFEPDADADADDADTDADADGDSEGDAGK